MRLGSLMTALALLVPATESAAQATGTPTFNAPYRAFSRSEFGALLSFPEGGGIAVEGIYRMASRNFDIGFKAGFLDSEGAGDVIFLAGAEARQRVITHNVDFPLDEALVLGIGAQFVNDGSTLTIPIGLSLGRRINVEDSPLSIVPAFSRRCSFSAETWKITSSFRSAWVPIFALRRGSTDGSRPASVM
jgi:hypothetical protein